MQLQQKSFNETLFDDEVTKALLNGINNKSVNLSNLLLDHTHDSIIATDGKTSTNNNNLQHSFGSSSSYHQLQLSFNRRCNATSNELSFILNSREDEQQYKQAQQQFGEKSSFRVDDSLGLEESSLFDDSGEHKETPFNLSNQNLEELIFQPDCADPETFLLKASRDQPNNFTSTLSGTGGQNNSSLSKHQQNSLDSPATDDSKTYKQKQRLHGTCIQLKHMNNSFQSLRRLQQSSASKISKDSTTRKNLNKSLFISSKQQSLIPKNNQIFQIHKVRNKRLQLPERILEEIDGDESVSGSPSLPSSEE